MKTYECTECGKEIKSEGKPAKPCTCGARGKWKEVSGLSTPDQSELFDIDLSVALLTIAWGKGDDHEIQKAMELIHDWQKRRQDRLTQLNLGKVGAL